MKEVFTLHQLAFVLFFDKFYVAYKYKISCNTFIFLNK